MAAEGTRLEAAQADAQAALFERGELPAEGERRQTITIAVAPPVVTNDPLGGSTVRRHSCGTPFRR
ncbi:hypothetical protein BH23CHL7_BH23CHL7_05200 [soil metagenome]